MAFNQEKWLRIVSPHISQPQPTEAQSKKYADAANDQAELTHAENIDLDALGEQRIKEAIQTIAEESTGDQGPVGPAAVPFDNAIVMVSSGKRFVENDAAFTVASHTFGAGELNGRGDLILVSCYQINLSSVIVRWTPPGAAAFTIYSNVSSPPSGKLDIWIAQAHNPIEITFDFSVVSNSSGVDSLSYTAGSLPQDWFDDGGVLDVNFDPIVGGKSGGQASIYKFNFPRVTQE